MTDLVTNIAYAIRLTLADVEPDIADPVCCAYARFPLQDAGIVGLWAL